MVLQNPLVQRVQEIVPENQQFVTILMEPAKMSLRDLIHQNEVSQDYSWGLKVSCLQQQDIYADWADKYTEIGTPLNTNQVICYGRQILQVWCQTNVSIATKQLYFSSPF